MSDADRLADIPAEAEYLAWCIMDPGILDRHPVWPGDMSSSWHSACLAAMLTVMGSGEPLDTLALRVQLLKDGAEPGMDFEERVLAVTNKVPVTEAAGLRARLRRLASDRDLETSVASALVAIQAGRADEVRAALLDVASATPGDDATRWASMRQAIEAAIEAVVETSERGTVKVPTGLDFLDNITHGYYPGDLTVLGGDTSVGKSSTMLLAAVVQARAGRRPGIISIEDPAARWGQRMLSAVSGVPVLDIQGANLTAYQWGRIQSASVDSAPLEITLAFEIGGTVADVTAAFRRLVRDGKCDVIYVDYLQAIEGGAGDRRMDQIRSIISAVKREANRPGAEVPVVLGSQLKRRQNIHERPHISDLYESGYIEQKAETIILLWRDKAGVVNAALAKAKDAPAGASWALERDERTGLLREASAFRDAFRDE